MSKSKMAPVLVGRWGRTPVDATPTEGEADIVMDPSRDFLLEALALQDRTITELRAWVKNLEEQRECLKVELAHANHYWEVCAGNLRAARKKNRELMLRANRLLPAGN